MAILTINDIKNKLRDHVPKPVGGWRYYSVLLPLICKNGELHILYELRSKTLEAQPGEVSFPGGSIEEGENPEETAIRETSEELGLPDSAIKIITELDYLVTQNNMTLYCFLGEIDTKELDRSEINIHEVEEYFLVPVSWLFENDPTIYVNRVVTEQAEDLPMEKLAPHGNYRWKGGTTSVPVYVWPDPDEGDDRYIWGMTARLTMSFINMIK